MVALTVAVHVASPAGRTPFTHAAVVFMGISAGITSAVHFTVLTLSHRADFAELPWRESLLTFQWPSVPYSLNILAWAVFFALPVPCLVSSFVGSRPTRETKILSLLNG